MMKTIDSRCNSFDHDAYAKTKAPTDFWGQIRRTVNGVPVADEQITLIVSTIKEKLQLVPSDVLLDLACGNGALSNLLFDMCAGCYGIDMSEYLIEVAQKNFEKLPRYRFTAQDAATYVRSESNPEVFNKVLCYGSFSYFPEHDARTVLGVLHAKFKNIEKIFIGNLPDKDKASNFHKEGLIPRVLGDSNSQIGIWRTKDEFSVLAAEAGWKVEFSVMPTKFYASHYRYDALLTR